MHNTETQCIYFNQIIFKHFWIVKGSHTQANEAIFKDNQNLYEK